MYQDRNLAGCALCYRKCIKGITRLRRIYSLTCKQTDRVLHLGRRRQMAHTSMRSHVDYWMPFNGGIGLHGRQLAK